MKNINVENNEINNVFDDDIIESNDIYDKNGNLINIEDPEDILEDTVVIDE